MIVSFSRTPLSAQHQAAAMGDEDPNASTLRAQKTMGNKDARHVRAQAMGQLGVLASYGIDGALLIALAMLGKVSFGFALAYLFEGVAACGFFYWLMRGGLVDGWRKYYMTTPQALLSCTVNMGFVLWMPSVGLLLLMGVFTIFAFSALRMSMGWVAFACGVMMVEIVGVVVLVGDRLALPIATWQERVVTGLWFALLLARSAGSGYYGVQVRRMLAQRNAELASTFKKLDQLANHDELTGVFNRRSVMRVLEDETQRFQRTGVPFSVALFDIDHFKAVNDTFGHPVGDAALRSFTAQATIDMRSTDRLGRYGGEEFLMVFLQTPDEASAVAAAERVRQGAEHFAWGEVAPGLSLTVSGGVSMSRRDETVAQLLARTDKALYLAKNAGRNLICVG
jgi:diguanylate cyclase (GGDEF)-like protein